MTIHLPSIVHQQFPATSTEGHSFQDRHCCTGELNLPLKWRRLLENVPIDYLFLFGIEDWIDMDWYLFFCICYMNNTVNNTGDFAHIGWTRWSLWMKQLLQVFAPYCAWHHRTYFEAPGNIHGVVRLRHLNMQLEKQITNSRTFGFLQFRKFLTRLKVHHIVQYVYI